MNWTETYSQMVTSLNFYLILVGIFTVLAIIANQMIEKNKKGKKSHA